MIMMSRKDEIVRSPLKGISLLKPPSIIDTNKFSNNNNVVKNNNHDSYHHFPKRQSVDIEFENIQYNTWSWSMTRFQRGKCCRFLLQTLDIHEYCKPIPLNRVILEEKLPVLQIFRFSLHKNVVIVNCCVL